MTGVIPWFDDAAEEAVRFDTAQATLDLRRIDIAALETAAAVR